MTESNHQRGGLLAWFAGNSVTANLLMIILMVGGFSVAVRLNAMTFPDVDPRQIAVSVPYRGATPEEVEESITRRVEEAVIGIEGVDRVRSNASEGSGLVTIDLKDFADAQKMKDDIETAVDQLANFPPEDAEQPSVTISEASADVMTLAVYGELAEEDLRAAAERVEADLLDLRDVSLVELQGAREREISIEVSEDALRRFGLSLDAVSNAVRAASVDLSGGTLRTTGGEILLRTDEERRDGRAFEDIVVASDPVGRTLFIRDVAVVRDAFEDDQLINTYRGQSAIFVVIGRSDDQDAFDISAAIKTMLGEYAPPTGVSVEIVDDSTTVIGDRLSLLAR
ncbi:MAG: efflux RND transporter permease subunit, partial [Pseudomonadota bacterium]